MRNMLLSLKPLLLFLVAASAAVAAATAADNVTVFRCCGRGEMLDDKDNRCTALPASEPQDFAPVIYDVSSSQFLAPNTTPPFWNMVQSRPSCGSLAFLEASPPGSPSSFVPFLNGSLWVQQWPLVDPGLFCLDRVGALVCQPDVPNRTRKCCGMAASYSEKKAACEFTGLADTDGLPADTVPGFPRCEDNLFVISGHINQTYWPVEPTTAAADAGWTVGGPLRAANGGATLQPREYCLDRVLEDKAPQPWTVFTCASRHEGDHVTKSYREDIRFTLYPLGLLLSVFFLAITLVASFMLPSTYHVLHWKCQVNHVGCLLVGDLFLAFVQLSGDSLRGPLCVFTGT